MRRLDALMGRLLLLLVVVGLGAAALALAAGPTAEATGPRAHQNDDPIAQRDRVGLPALPALRDSIRHASRSALPPLARGRPASAIMQRALAIEGERRVNVAVGRLRDTLPGQMVMRCLEKQVGADLERLRERSNFDPLRQIHEMGVIDGLAVARGDYADVDWASMRPDRALEAEPYGDNAVFYLEPGRDRGVAVYKNELLIGDANRQGLRAAIDRLEGRGELADVNPVRGTAGELPAVDLFAVLPVSGDIRHTMEKYLHEHGVGLSFALDADDDGVHVAVEIQGDDEVVDSLAAALESVKNGGVAPHQRDKLTQIVNALELSRTGDGLRIRGTASIEMLRELMGDCADE